MVWNIGFKHGMGVNNGLFELDGDLNKIEYVDGPKDWAGLGGVNSGRLNLGRAIKPDHVPTRFQWDGPRNRQLPDAMYSRGILLVSDRLKEIIERFEPGLHQFFPIDVFHGKSGELVKKMYFLNICTRLDSVDRELTTSKLDYSMWRPDLGGQMVFNLDQIGNHQLWHDKHIFKGRMLSNALHDAMVDAGITGLVFHKDIDNTEWR